MILKDLTIKNFRNYSSMHLIFEKGINYLFGPNGTGKTNLLESIYYISNLESFRSNDDKDLIKEKKDYFKIEASIDEKKYSLLINQDKKDLRIDEIPYKVYRDYIGNSNVIEFTPEQVYLLKDYPKERRRFIDREISKIDSNYLNDVLVYNKLIKQRNELLKSNTSYIHEVLGVIDKKISELQVRIITKRDSFLKGIESRMNDNNTTFIQNNSIKIIYESCFYSLKEEDILKKYEETFEKDKEKGLTQLGIHKDDFKVLVNNKEAANYCSQGEQRFIILLMKLALLETIKEEKNYYPILVLDDVFSELDENRKKELISILRKYDQVFITGCNLEEMCNLEGINKYDIKKINGGDIDE